MFLKAVVLIRGQFCPPGYRWQYVNAFWMITALCVCTADVGQGEDRDATRRRTQPLSVIQPPMSAVLRLKAPGVKAEAEVSPLRPGDGGKRIGLPVWDLAANEISSTSLFSEHL